MRCENGTRFYIDDFVEDLNYRKIILSIGDVVADKVGHISRFDRYCISNKLFFIENCDLQEVDTQMEPPEIYGNSFLYLVIEEGYSIIALHYDEKGDQWYFDLDAFVDTFIES